MALEDMKSRYSPQPVITFKRDTTAQTSPTEPIQSVLGQNNLVSPTSVIRSISGQNNLVSPTIPFKKKNPGLASGGASLISLHQND